MNKEIIKKWLILTWPNSTAYIGSPRTRAMARIRSASSVIKRPGISGHAAVTRSIINGLNKNGLKYYYNVPFNYRKHEYLYVVSHPQTLVWAINLKRRGYVRKIVAGPNIVVMPDEAGGILNDAAIDKIITPSRWVKESYEQQSPALKKKIVCWQAGVDISSWESSKSRTKKTALIYWKTEPKKFLDDVIKVLEKFGFEHQVIRYGEYTHKGYRAILEKSSIAVFISRSESQGIALYESWAANVPTLVWDPQNYSYRGWVFNPSTSSPFLTNSTGYRWKDLAELDELVSEGKYMNLQPRKWVERNATDQIAVEKLVKILKKVENE